MGTKERKARQKDSLRQEILDAARDLFVREGYESVSMRKIADKVEYSPGTLYLHFRDKTEILDCLCEETFDKLRRKMQAIEDDRGDPLEALRRGLRLYIQFGVENPGHYVVTFVLGKQHAEDCQRKKQAGFACFDHLRYIVGRCISEGRIGASDVEDTAQALWAGAHGMTTLLISQCEFPFVEQTRLIERMLEILVEGVRAR